MLRGFVVALGVALVAAAAVVALAAPAAWPAALECAILSALIIGGTLFERHYRSRRAASGGQWETTSERFIDPTTGQLQQVRYNPQTGERSYEPLASDRFKPV